jgi:hypothetical protein
MVFLLLINNIKSSYPDILSNENYFNKSIHWWTSISATEPNDWMLFWTDTFLRIINWKKMLVFEMHQYILPIEPRVLRNETHFQYLIIFYIPVIKTWMNSGGHLQLYILTWELICINMKLFCDRINKYIFIKCINK